MAKEKNKNDSSLSTPEQNSILANSSKIFATVNVLLIAIAGFFSLTISIILVVFFLLYILYLSDFGQRKIKKLKIWWAIRPYLKASKSLNHSTTLVGKYILEMPLKEKETEIDTFMDIQKHFGNRWPFMVKVQDTRAKQITVKGKPTKCMSSYNYLDLGRDESVQKAGIDAANAYSSGNHGPRMLCGNLQILEDLEVKISKFFKKEAALVFSSGFLACMSTISGIARKGDLLLMDKLCHSSLRHGAKTCNALTVNFKHNDFVDAEKLIKKNKFNRLIMVIEGIYSMDGDIGDLPTARKLCDKYNGILIVDEAHSLGTIGKTGHGVEEHFNYTAKADIICGSFTKSLSSVGGYLTCSKELREFYTFYGPGVVFSAPLSAYHAGAAFRSLEVIEEKPELVTKLQKNGDYLRKKLRDNNFNIGESVSCVIPVIYRDSSQLIEMHDYILSKGFFAAAVMAPACALDAPRYRVCANASDTFEFLDEVVNILIEAREKCPESERIKKLIEAIK